MSGRRVWAIFRKEMQEFRRNKQIVSTMAFSPIGFLVAPLIFVFSISASDVSVLDSYPVLLFTLALAAVLPTVVGAYSITSEREQGTLEPLLATPISAAELMLGKALAVFIPSITQCYLIFGVIDALVELIRPAVVSAAALRPPILLAQLIFTPLLVCMAVWLSITISAHTRDGRVAQQFGFVANIPVIALAVLVGFHVIRATLPLTLTLGAVLVVLDIAGWPLAAKTFDRERLILGAR